MSERMARNLWPIVPVLMSLVATTLLLLLVGGDPTITFSALLDGALGTSDRLFSTMAFWVPLLLCASGLLVSFTAGLWNIGVEGQLYIGSLACAWIAFTFQGLPGLILIPLSVLGAMAGGAAWGFIPGYLKARFGSHEVINTIMLNFIAMALCNYLVVHHFMEPGQMTAHGNVGHRFHAAADRHIGPTGHYPQGGIGDGFKTRRTEAVDCGCRNVLRKTGNLADHPGNVEPLLGLRKGTADHDIFYVLFLEVGRASDDCG